ncbi:MAG: immunity 70 family protein [Lachnospiraceae bacterium]|nr:immunity 70 family protein [Lachnospiraceae bacterium]
MAVGFKVDFYWYQVGNGDFLYSFFSTVAYRLEGAKWGSRFPVIMKKLYQGKIKRRDVDKAIKELNIIKKELQAFAPDQVVWNIEDLSEQPPWGNDISEDITDLSNYFVTSEGEDFISVFLDALETAKEIKSAIEIVSI